MEIAVYGNGGEKVGSISLDEGRFGGPIRKRLLRDAVIMYEANKRQGNACTKTRSEVAGGGKKPWKQKHTGRARVGSARSPLWRGGGVSFGPKPRDYSYSMPKKAKKQALFSALAAKIRDNECLVANDFTFDVPKTKQIVDILKALGIHGDSCLIVTSKTDEVIRKSARNIPSVKVMPSSELNAYEVLRQKKILITREALGNLT
ncbi:MAG: 50S ribosomal protein L4 [Candidatus Brocadiaceae bacterium]|nr:50S ribosomal protein L4 [Candidatus Brocadiaceae bacterium]